MGEPYRTRSWTTEEVLRLVELGILQEDEHIELIDGELVEMASQGPLHSGWKNLLRQALVEAYAGVGFVHDQSPLDCGPSSLPEPDIAVLTGDLTHFLQRHPRGQEALLVLEVSWTSHAIDRRKAATYARGGVAEYWLVDLRGRRVEVHREAADDGYGVVTILGEGQSVVLPGLDREWRVADLLPPATG